MLKRISLKTSTKNGLPASTSTRSGIQKIFDYRKTVKINALKAAKEKADYLLESMGKKTGNPLEIVEIEDYTSDTVLPINFRAKTANIQLEAADANVDYSFENIDNIKLKYSIKTKYEIL
jgi:uncharacterized protein YggE